LNIEHSRTKKKAATKEDRYNHDDKKYSAEKGSDSFGLREGCMKIILKHDVDRLGSAGDIKNVSDGYARNFLLPRGLVFEATKSNLKTWENENKAREKRNAEAYNKAQEKAKELEKLSCTISVKSGEDKKMFGAVTAAHIAESLTGMGYAVDKKDIHLAEPIKELGAYTVDVRVASGVQTKVKVWVVEEQ